MSRRWRRLTAGDSGTINCAASSSRGETGTIRRRDSLGQRERVRITADMHVCNERFGDVKEDDERRPGQMDRIGIRRQLAHDSQIERDEQRSHTCDEEPEPCCPAETPSATFGQRRNRYRVRNDVLGSSARLERPQSGVARMRWFPAVPTISLSCADQQASRLCSHARGLTAARLPASGNAIAIPWNEV
jgi:hypothetical protein